MRKEMVWVPFGGESIIGIGEEERIYRLHKDRDTDKKFLSFLTRTENGKIGTPNQVLAYELYKTHQYSIYSIGILAR